MNKVITDPAKILKFSKEELVNYFAMTCQMEEDILAQKKAIKDVLFEKIEGNGEIVGDYSIVKAKRVNFKVDLEKAKELGAVKPAVDTKILKELYNKGIKIPHSVTEYLLIKIVKK